MNPTDRVTVDNGENSRVLNQCLTSRSTIYLFFRGLVVNGSRSTTVLRRTGQKLVSHLLNNQNQNCGADAPKKRGFSS
jgi:hypothetical protein